MILTRFPPNAVWYHGSSREFERFQLPKRYSPQEQLGFGIHLARDKAFAERYGSVIYKCRVRPARVLNLIATYREGSPEHQLAKEVYRGSRYRPLVWDGEFGISLDVTSPKRAETLLRKYGYDAVFYSAEYGSRAIGGKMIAATSDSVVMLDPAKIEILDVQIQKKTPSRS